jgi:AraC-like DNA-binding protein
MKTATVVSGEFRRPLDGPSWNGATAWRSNGGHARSHPDRALPSTLEVTVPAHSGRLERVCIVGVLATHASPDVEPSGAVGGTVQFMGDGKVVHRRDLVQGRHYGDAADAADVYRLNGDGSSVETVGRTVIADESYRVDRIAIEVAAGLPVESVVLRDLGTPASFVVFDVLFEFEEAGVCPFKGQDDNVALSEIGSILRLRDRATFDRALHQLCQGVRECGDDLDEARGLTLTFIGAVVAAMLEIEPQRSLHTELLEAAREFERADNAAGLSSSAVRRIHALTQRRIPGAGSHAELVIDKALDTLARRFAEDLDAGDVAKELNLSTSHFRHLFRQTTRQPFHKYVVSLRLEKARELLLQSEMSVTDVAEAVGFQSSAHFSRAFAKRFKSAPSALRQSRR